MLVKIYLQFNHINYADENLFQITKTSINFKTEFRCEVNCYIQNQASISKMEHRLEI